MTNKYLILSAVFPLFGFLPESNAAFLGSADNYAVLAGSTVTSTGATVLNGNMGLYPGTAITGFPPGIVNATKYVNNGVAQTAKADALTAYNALKTALNPYDLTGQDLGGLTLSPGVYHFDSSAQLTGKLYLNAPLNSSELFVFQIGSTLTTASDSSVFLLAGAQAANVFWQVGSSATLGTSTSFKGSILADQSITLNTGANMIGRAFALNAAVTLDKNVIDIPTLLFASTAVPEL
jgi:type VI secretion system secreted protein VgrG